MEQYSRIRLYHPRIYHPAAYIGHFQPEPNFYIIKPPDISSSSPVISATLRCEREHLRALSRTNCPNCRCNCLRDTFPASHSHNLFANISDCVSFVQDGSNETDKSDMERKSCDPGRARAHETWHKPTQCSRATQHHRIGFFFHNTAGISRMNWAAPVLSSSRLCQPLWSGPHGG